MAKLVPYITKTDINIDKCERHGLIRYDVIGMKLMKTEEEKYSKRPRNMYTDTLCILMYRKIKD